MSLLDKLTLAERLQLDEELGQRRDFIPNGRHRRDQFVVVFRAPPYPVHQCGCQTGYDVQSGPIYCGDTATWWAHGPLPESVFAMCNRHVGWPVKKSDLVFDPERLYVEPAKPGC